MTSAQPPAPPIAAVLAGGAARRLPAKPGVDLGGRPMISHPVAAARSAGLATVVVGKPGRPLPPLDCAVVLEPRQPVHPLCGVVAALRHAAGRAVLALGCDMPFVTPSLLAWMAAQDGALAAAPGGRPQPLLARYPPQALAVLEEALAEGAAARVALARLAPDVLDDRRLARFGEPARLCFNVNSRADLERARRMLVAVAACG